MIASLSDRDETRPATIAMIRPMINAQKPILLNIL
jgi:hypothetical protein